MQGPATYQGHPSERYRPHATHQVLFITRGMPPMTCQTESSSIHFLVHLCVHFIKAIVCHGKQLLPHKEKLSDDTAFGNGDTFLLVSFSSLSLHPLSAIAVAAMGSPADKRLCLPMKGNRGRNKPVHVVTQL